MKTTYQVTVEHDTALPDKQEYRFCLANALHNKLQNDGIKVIDVIVEVMGGQAVEMLALPVVSMPLVNQSEEVE